jgi:superfamily II RNA helicase
MMSKRSICPNILTMKFNSGIYRLAPTLRTGIVVVHQLPATPETLWFRLLGRDGVQAKAAQELTNLPLGSLYREETIQLLVSLKIQLETQKKTTSKDRKLIMNLSPLYLEQISQAEQRGRIEVLLRQLNRQVGKLTPALEQQLIALSVTQIGDLGEALLNFHNEEDLLLWLSSLN